MPLLEKGRVLRSLRKTPVILHALVRDMSEEYARTATDGPDGWSVLYVMCHLRDFEAIYYGRFHAMLDTHNPHFPPEVDNDTLAVNNDYDHQTVHGAFETYLEGRRVFYKELLTLTDAQWQRPGVHPIAGDITIMELAMNVALHDVNHIEQIVRALGLSEALLE